jgi:uncharacterized membrane protein
MARLSHNFLRNHRQIMVVGALVMSSTLCLGLLVLRVIHTGSYGHIFLVWNLFLAWMPMIMALGAYNFHKRHSRLNGLIVAGCALAWLLFMPNAPYIVTDIVNLYPQPSIPFWYDIILFAAFAWTGVFLGLVSLFLMQEIVRKTAGRLLGWLFALGVLALSSFGIYLGRFLRWNSWDVVLNPGQLLGDIAATIRHPVAHFETYVFSAMFAVFMLCAYLMLTAMMNFRQEAQGQ